MSDPKTFERNFFGLVNGIVEPLVRAGGFSSGMMRRTTRLTFLLTLRYDAMASQTFAPNAVSGVAQHGSEN